MGKHWIFSDYAVPERESLPSEKVETAMVEPFVEDELQSKMRQWTLSSGKVVDAEFVMEFGDKVVLKTPRGKQVKVPTREFSTEDLDYLELVSPPPLKITFLKETDVFRFKDLPNTMRPPTMHNHRLPAGVSRR